MARTLKVLIISVITFLITLWIVVGFSTCKNKRNSVVTAPAIDSTAISESLNMGNDIFSDSLSMDSTQTHADTMSNQGTQNNGNLNNYVDNTPTLSTGSKSNANSGSGTDNNQTSPVKPSQTTNTQKPVPNTTSTKPAQNTSSTKPATAKSHTTTVKTTTTKSVVTTKPVENKTKTPEPKAKAEPQKKVNKTSSTGTANSSKKFLVIAGSFLDKANANILKNKIAKFGLNSEVVNFNYSQYYTVLAGRYVKEQDARNTVAKLRKKGYSSYVHKKVD